jgi:hypothetical protein
MRFTYKKTCASGRRESWAKLVHGTDHSLRGAKAFKGDYLQAGSQIDLPEGAVVLEVCPEGSVKNGYQQAYVKQVRNDVFVSIGDCWNWHSEFLDLVDAVELAICNHEWLEVADVNLPDLAVSETVAAAQQLAQLAQLIVQQFGDGALAAWRRLMQNNVSQHEFDALLGHEHLYTVTMEDGSVPGPASERVE